MASAVMSYDDSRHTPALVAVTVPKMGRMAIHRSEARHILGGGSGGPMQLDTRSSTSGTSSIGSISQSSTSTMLTQPSQHDDDCDETMAIVSPSYTVMSSFPSSQQTTPAGQTFDYGVKSAASLARVQEASIKAWSGTASHSRGKSGSSPSSTPVGRELAVAALFKATAAGLSGEERMRAIRAALPKLKMHMSNGEPSVAFKPTLPGSGMPRLDWPDSPEGPWNMSGKENLKRQERRQNAITRWLAAESSDEEGDATTFAAPQQEQQTMSSSKLSHRHQVSSMPQDQHPMVVKALHDRKRKETLATARLAHFAKQQQHHIHLQQQQLLQSTPQAKRPKLGSRQNSSVKSARKEVLSQPLNLTPSERRAAQRQARRRQKDAAKAAKFMMPGGHYPGGTHMNLPPPPPPFHEAPYARGGQVLPHIACRCGHGDNGSPMLRCDGCLAWHHASCVGLHDVSQITQDWLCYACCAADASMVSPSSVADSTAASLMVTPNFPRSTALEGHALRLSQGELPVFSHPSETPFRRPDGHAHHGLSSALALAPSPVMLTSDDMAKRGVPSHAAATSTTQAGRPHAARVGWHMQEPGSPLDRKSMAQPSHRRNLSGSAFRGGHKSALEHHEGLGPDSMSAFLHTPSPRLLQTPHRQRDPSVGGFGRLQQTSMAAPHSTTTSSMPFAAHRRETSTVRDFDDVFSTPSRMLHGTASWDHGPSTSMLRRNREESMNSTVGNAAHSHGSAQRAAPMPHGTPSWALSTPTRGMMDNSGIFSSSEYSGAADELPSLVHSSGGVDLGDFASWQHLQGSPTSSTRAGARAALSSSRDQHFYSGANRRTSSMREGTPDAMPYSADPSSSPFPRTPTFVSDAYGGYGSSAYHARRLSATPNAGILPSPSFGTPSRKGNAGAYGRHQRNASMASNNGMLDALGGPLELHGERRPASYLGNNSKSLLQQQYGTAAPGALAARNRKVSTDVMAGLGIGLDLNDVLDWQ